jgi:hypothetical protein
MAYLKDSNIFSVGAEEDYEDCLHKYNYQLEKSQLEKMKKCVEIITH